MENNIQKLLEKNEIEKNYERAVKFYDETIKDKSNFSTIDVSFIASSEIEKNRKDLEKELVKCIPEKTVTEIAANRDLCITVLEQDMHFYERTENEKYLIKRAKEEIFETEKVPEFIYPEYVPTIIPAEPKKPSAKTVSIFSVFKCMRPADSSCNFFIRIFRLLLSLAVCAGLAYLVLYINEKYKFNQVISSIILGLVYNVGMLALVGVPALLNLISVFREGWHNYVYSRLPIFLILFPFFVISVPIIIVLDIVRVKNRNKKYKAEINQYKIDKERIEKSNAENLNKWKKARKLASNEFWQKYKDGAPAREQIVLSYKEEIFNSIVKICCINLIYNDIQRKIFACPAAFDSYSTKKRIVQYLKELKATTFTEAINKIESDDRIIMETTAQEEFRQRSIELQEARNKAEKEHQVRQEEFQRIKVEEIKKQREAVQQQNEEMKKTFEDMKKQLEEIASQSNNSTSENYYYSPQTTGLDEYDIERAVERALKNN